MEKYILSQMTDKNFTKAVTAIYMQTIYNNDQYPEYLKWFYTVNIPRIFKERGRHNFLSRWVRNSKFINLKKY